MAGRQKKRSHAEQVRVAGEVQRPKRGKPRAPRRDGRAKARELYLSNPDWSIARVAKEMKVPLGRVQGWCAQGKWTELREQHDAELVKSCRDKLVRQATEQVGGDWLAMLEAAGRINRMVAARIVRELEDEEQGKMRLITVESERQTVTGKDGEPCRKTLRRMKERVRANDRLLERFLESADRWAGILYGLTTGTNGPGGPFPGRLSGPEDAAKVVQKLQAAAVAMQQLDDVGQIEGNDG